MDGKCHLPYFPNQYFRRQVIVWIVENRQKVFKYMGPALKATYGVVDPRASHGGPFSFKSYLMKMMKWSFWGDETVLWSVSMMWGLKIMVVNSKMLQEYRIHHDVALRHVDVALVYNASTHYSAAGKSCAWSLVILLLWRYGRLEAC